MKKIDVIQPACFSRFACLEKECQYSCCQEWNIFLTRSEYTKIKSQIHSREMQDAFCAAFVRQKEKKDDKLHFASVRYREDGSCPLQTPEGMCSLQLACGHGALPVTCQIFPRVESVWMGRAERHLTLGCEAVSRLLLDLPDGICLETVSASPNRRAHPTLYISREEAEKRPVYQYVWDIKTLCVAALQDRSRSLEDRMLLLGVFLAHIHRLEQEEKTDQIPGFVDEMLRTSEDDLDLSDWDSIEINPNVPIINALILLNQLKDQSRNAHLIQMVERLLTQFEIVTEMVGPEKEETAASGNEASQAATALENEASKTATAPGNETSQDVAASQAASDSENATASQSTAPWQIQMTMNLERNQENQKKYAKWLAKYGYFVENIMVAWFFQEQIPFSKKGCSVWEHYVYFCSLYNLLKIILMGTVSAPDWTMDQVIHCITVCARSVTHSSRIPQDLMKRAEESGSDTLAHMAVLIKS